MVEIRIRKKCSIVSVVHLKGMLIFVCQNNDSGTPAIRAHRAPSKTVLP